MRALVSIGTILLTCLTASTTPAQDTIPVLVVGGANNHDVEWTTPSLAEILAETSGLSYDNDCRHGRFGDVGARTDREIGVHALRGGDVVGDHTVVYAGDGERIELTHKASSRMTFAHGAVRAARWLAGHDAGLYSMQDVLELK